MKLFICLDATLRDDNIDFNFLSSKEEKQILKKFEDIDSYLMNNSWETWMEVPITRNNCNKLSELITRMQNQLKKTKR